MQTVSEYGYPFRKSPLLVIGMSNEDALQTLKAARRTNSVSLTFPASRFPDIVPAEVYFISEDTWYNVRFHECRSTETDLTISVHGVKPMFMASACLSHYQKIYDNGTVSVLIRRDETAGIAI